MILAIEGAPGVGKTTTAAALAESGAVVVPEVNLLFARPEPEPDGWYFDRQNARWEMARLASVQGRLAVLDGDPLQPIWFGWTFADENRWPTPTQSIAFYRRRFAEGRMQVPDRYVILHVNEDVRRRRMLARELARDLGAERAQRKVDRYARLVEPQIAFFRALAERFPGWIAFVEAAPLDRSVAAIPAAADGAGAPDSLAVLDFIEAWFRTPV